MHEELTNKVNKKNTMKLFRIMPAALLLSVCLNASAQDDDELQDEATGEEVAEAVVPTSPTERNFFHRVQLGFVGTNAKYTNNAEVRHPGTPESEKYFLKGLSLGWMGDIHIAKKIPLYLELGGSLAWQTGSTTGDPVTHRTNAGDGVVNEFCYKVNTFTFTIPVSVNYQFRNIAGVDGLTVAPSLGVYARFNLIAKRKQTKTITEYGLYDNGQDVINSVIEEVDSRSLLKDERKGGWMEGRPHAGKLLQCGAQVGVNVYYKHYSLGLAYMYDLMPFAKHSSPLGIVNTPTSEGGNLPVAGTGCDMKISTCHNFAVNFGYIF